MKRKKKSLSAPELMARIKSGRSDPCQLGPDSRQQCVEYLQLEGVTVAEIAQILQCSERTIGRDRRAILERNALDRDPELSKMMAGMLVTELENSKGRIRRATRVPGTSVADKIAGEQACFLNTEKLVARLQSLGFLPTASTKVEADVRVGTTMDLNEIRREAERLRRIDESEKRKRVPSKSSITPKSNTKRKDSS